MSTADKASRFAKALLHRLTVVAGAIGMTVALFLVLPLMQSIASASDNDLIVQAVEAVNVPPPPPVVEEEPPEPEEVEPEPPQLNEAPKPLDLSQLELALNPGIGEGWLAADFALDLKSLGGGNEEVDALFSMSDLDQKPRPIYRAQPALNAQTRKKGGGVVLVIFIVDEEGRVQKPKVESSSDPVFELPAMNAIKKWKFEPGKRGGKPVSTRARQRITFPD